MTGAAWFAGREARADTAGFSQWADGIKAQKSGATIRVLGISHPASDAMKAMTPEFEQATGIKVDWEVVGSGEIMSKQFLAQTAGQSSYDVHMVKGTALAEYDSKKVLVDLKDRLAAIQQEALPGNPYDGHTLATIIPDMEKTIGNQIERILVDAGYRGHNAPDSYKFRVFTAGQKRRVTRRFCARCGAAQQSSR
jgi:ABC-type glycerol-3-phosphate transport system substrate-binding protein